jgi:hypothetical protein
MAMTYRNLWNLWSGFFSTLKSLTTTYEKLCKELSEIEEVWDCITKIFPLLCSTIFMEVTERADLMAYFEDFGELFTKNTTKNPTPEMHSLFSCQSFLEEIWLCWFVC